MANLETLSSDTLKGYEFGQAAATLEGSEQRGALELLAKALGRKEDDGFYRATLQNEDGTPNEAGMKYASKIFATNYQKAYEDSPISEIFTYLNEKSASPLKANLKEGAIKIIKAVLSPYLEKKVSEVKKELKEQVEFLKKIAKGEDGNISEADIVKATVLKSSYINALNLLNMLEAGKINELQTIASNKGRKGDSASMYKKITDYLTGGN